MNAQRKPPKPKQAKSRPPKMTAADWFKRGSKLASRGELDDAIAAFRSAVQRAPANLLYRKTLRAAEYRKYHNNRTGGYATHASLLRLRAQLNEAKQQRKWKTVDDVAEDGLALNPWDVDLNVELGHACQARGYRDVARFAFECALESAPDRDDLRQLLAELEVKRKEPQMRTDEHRSKRVKESKSERVEE